MMERDLRNDRRRLVTTALSPSGRQSAVEHIVDRDGSEQTTRFVTHADRQHVVRGEPLGDLAVADVGGDGGFGFQTLPEFHSGGLAQEPLKVNHTEVPTRGWFVRRAAHEHL